MEATYHFNINELNNDFLSMLKKQFTNAKAKLVIRDIEDIQKIQIETIQENEKDYLFITDAKHRRKKGEKLYNLDDVINEYQ